MSPRSRVRSLLFLLLLFLAASVPGWAQGRPPTNTLSNRTFFIQGSLRREEGNQTVEMVRVDLKKLTGEVVATSFTRSNGEFQFAGLSSGTYYIVIEEKGYEPIREAVEIINSSRLGVYLFLKHPLELGVPQPGHTVSARELTIPRKAREALEKGMERLYDKKDAKGSLNFFQRAVTELPSYYEAYEQMGMANMFLGQTAEAEQAFRKSIEISESKYAAAYFRLASLFSDNGRYAEAEPVARQGLTLDSNPWSGHFELARALLGLKRPDDAEKSAAEARNRRPDFPPLHLLLANIHIQKHDYPALVADLDTYLKLEPKGPMSEQARETREKVRGILAKAQDTPTPPKP
jgi:Carboxypeptidase regulatory-like domain/Tetratricopeptide repeat